MEYNNTSSSPNTGGNQASYDAAFAIAVLIRHKWLIMLTMFVTAATTSYISWYHLDNWYASTTNLVPPKKTTTLLDGLSSNISSTLKDIGLSKMAGGKGGGADYSPLVVLNSRRLLDTLITLFDLAEVYDIPDTAWSDLRRELMANMDANYEREGNYTITVWHKDRYKAAEMANFIPVLLNKFTTDLNQTEARINRQVLEKRYHLTNERLSQVADSLKLFSKKYKIFAPEDQAKAASTAIADLRYELLRQEIAVEMSASLLGASDPKTLAQQQLLEEMRRKANELQSMPGFIGDFPLDEGADIAVDYARLLADVEVFGKLKAFLIPSLEQARLDEERVVPELLVLDPAVPADKKSRPKRSLIVAGATFGVGFLVMGLVLLRYRVRAARKKWNAILEAERGE